MTRVVNELQRSMRARCAGSGCTGLTVAEVSYKDMYHFMMQIFPNVFPRKKAGGSNRNDDDGYSSSSSSSSGGDAGN